MNRVFLCISLAFFYVALAWSQGAALPNTAELQNMPPKELEFQAQQYYENQEYLKAFYYYRALVQSKKRVPIEWRYRLGKTAIDAAEYALAVEELEFVAQKRERKYPQARFECARAYKFQGKYEKALEQFREYVEKNKKQGLSNPFLDLALRHIEACEKAQKAEEFGQYAVGAASTEFAGDAKAQLRSLTNPGLYGWRLVEHEDEQGICIKKVSGNMDILDIEGSAGNPLFYSGSPHIAADRRSVYFSRLERKANGNREYKLYTGQLTEEGNIIDIEKLNSAVNPEGYSSLSPSSSRTLQGQEILYFSSDMPGGEGGFDIWYSVRMTNGQFTRPYNLGVRINSANDEITPFFHEETGELYFSSDKPESYGGFDIYKMLGEKRRWEGQGAEQLPFPLNSHGNDTHFIIDEDGNGSLNSDRDGGKSQPLRFQDTKEQPARP